MVIETKYNIGDEVWFLQEGKARAATVIAIEALVVKNGDMLVRYKVERARMIEIWGEKGLSPTKEELLNCL